MSKNLTRRALLCAAGALPLAARAQAGPLKVAFVYVSPVGSAGWSYQHDLGRQQMVQALGNQVATTVVEAVPEGADAERVLRDLAQQGHGLVFATSFGYLEPALRVAVQFPQVKFEHAGGWKTAPNLGTYNGRFYEGRWLAGWLAGKASARGVAGYVAGFPVPEVVQGVNAFALGMRAANPAAQVRLVWLNSWFDPARERDAAATLVAQGADVLANHSASPAVAQAAQELGVHLLAYQSDMGRFAPQAQLASVTQHWGGHYTEAARAVLAGRWQPRQVWGGLRDGMVQLSAVAPRLAPALRQELAALQAEMSTGRRHAFAGPLRDQAGTLRLASGTLDDARINAMDWLVQGVQGSMPRG